MRRSMAKAIEEYQDKHCPGDSTKCAFYASDVQQIIKMSNGVYDVIANALMAGFTVGYRCAKSDERRKKK